MHVLQREAVLQASISEAFAYCHDPRNLAGITPNWMSFDIVHIDEGEMRAD
jgi:hypothetical protein